MIQRTLVPLVLSATFVLTAVDSPAQTSREDIKSQARSSGVRGDASAETPSRADTAQQHKSRAEVKRERGGSSGSQSAESAVPPKKSAGKTREQVKSERGGTRGDEPADRPYPPVEQK